MSRERPGAAFSTHPKVTRRGRGLDSSFGKERICATARPDPGSETASFTAALTPTLRPRRPSLVRARSVIASPPGGRIRPAATALGCRGDLTSDTLAGAQRSTALDAGPKAFVVQRRPFRHAAVAWSACRCRPAARVLGSTHSWSASAGVCSSVATKQTWKGVPSTHRHPKGQCLGGANPCGLAPRANPFGGADSRASHEETARPHRQTHFISGPAAAGCQSLHSRGMMRLSSRHFSGPSTCPRKRVFKSFP